MARMDKAKIGEQAPQSVPAGKKRTYLSQADVPAHSLDEALRIAFAISDQYGKQPTTPVDVATALQLMPTGGHFKTLTGAAVAYGITEGGSQADVIELTDLGRRIVAPTEEGDDLAARREALLRPRVVREFLQKYNGSPLPSDQIGQNVLEGMAVPGDRTERTLSLIVNSADSLGLLSDIGGRKVVNLRAALVRVVPSIDHDAREERDDDRDDPGGFVEADEKPPAVPPAPAIAALPDPNRKVFISHGSNKKIVDQLKSMLEYGGFEPIVSVERETTAKPVPKKVFDDMRSCMAGIIHVAKEQTIVDRDGNEHHFLNDNVLTEIGGGIALWSDNFILLVEDGTKLPTNLQGLYEVRYVGSVLDADATMRLLKAFKDFKS